MKRITVRLSIVAAVLVLGGATIAHSVLTKRAATSPNQSVDDPQALAEFDAARTPVPIQVSDADYAVPAVSLQPPPSFAFPRTTPLKNVSHETAVKPGPPSTVVPPDLDADAPFVPPMDETADATYSAYSEYDPGVAAAPRAANSVSLPAEKSVANSSASRLPLTAGSTSAAEADDISDPDDYAKAFPASPTGDSTSVSGAPSTTRDPSDAGFPPRAATSPSPVASPTAIASSVTPSLPATAGLSVTPALSVTPPASAASSLSATPPANAASSLSVTPPPADAPPPKSSPVSGGPVAGFQDRAASSASSPVQPAEYPSYPPPYPSTGQELTVQPSRGLSLADSAGATAGAWPALTSDVPGDRRLEGQQSPTIVIEKTVPDEIQVNQPVTFQLHIRNIGTSAAHGVVVTDQIPRGTEFISATPTCTHSPDGRLVWNLETLEANEDAVLALELLPKLAGEIGSVAQVSFQAQAAVRTVCTQPQLTLELTAPEQVLVGTPATLDIVVTNTGSGAATNVVIEEDVPEGFTHAAGRQLEHEVGTLRPQESRRLSLVLTAERAGVYQNRLVVHGAGDLLQEDVRRIEIAAPQLELSMDGPVLRYLDRQATYVIRMGNPGTAPARNVELVAHLPKGMQYVTSDNHGQYDSQAHAVYWNLEELPAARQGDVHLTVLPVELGSQKLKAEGRGEAGLQHACEHEVSVEGLAGLTFTITDVADPIEVGSTTTYEIRVENRGSKADRDIRVAMEMPPGMLPVGGDGPAPASVRGQLVDFDPLPQLAPGEEAIYKIVATGQNTGDHVIRAQVRSAELRVPVTKEEITRVYTDR